jgi:hypothetical protein
MTLFRRRDRISPDFLAVPAEHTVVPDEVRIADLDAKLRSIAAFPRGERGQGPEWQTDRLLDEWIDIRKKQRKGRVDSIIDNYWENPW